jgi:transcriptional regulator with XRE-family HTH domain
MTGEDLKKLRATIGHEVIGSKLTLSQMAKLCGLSDPAENGADTIRKWERSEGGPSGPVAALLETFAQVADAHASGAFRDAMASNILKRLRA